AFEVGGVDGAVGGDADLVEGEGAAGDAGDVEASGAGAGVAVQDVDGERAGAVDDVDVVVGGVVGDAALGAVGRGGEWGFTRAEESIAAERAVDGQCRLSGDGKEQDEEG